MKKLLKLDWDVIAGIAAAGLAIILHLLHVVQVEILLTIALVLLALLLFRDLRKESRDEEVASALKKVDAGVQEMRSALNPAEAILIGPRNLRAETRRFVESARGQMVWFNVCVTMFRRQEVFDLLLRPAIENSLVDSIQFIASEGERELWNEYMAPRINECGGSERVAEPLWRQLPQTVSFILADMEPGGSTEALLSFWGEPFMARSADKQLPRYVFWIQAHSDLVSQFVELERQSRMASS